jgi:hypothetical protein
MLIVEIKALDNGAHRNQDGSVLPSGWVVVPPEVGTMETLPNFPFGDFEVEEIDGVQTMKKDSWMPLLMPEPEPDPIPEPEEPSTDDTNVWDELDAAYQEGVDSI